MFEFHSVIVFLLFSITSAENLHSFVFNISNVEYRFQCGLGFCDGFHNYCHYTDEDIQSGICRPCTEDMCSFEFKLPDQCRVMCKIFGYVKDSEKIPHCEDQSTYRTNDQLLPTPPSTPSSQDDGKNNYFWKMVSLTGVLINIILVSAVVLFLHKGGYFCSLLSKIRACKNRNSKSFSIITKPSDDPTSIFPLNPFNDNTGLKV